jgi:hypothetical protein
LRLVAGAAQRELPADARQPALSEVTQKARTAVPTAPTPPVQRAESLEEPANAV